MDTADPIIDEIASRWRALLAGEATRQSTVRWAQAQLTNQSWTHEVAHRGLQLLNDLHHERWTVAGALGCERSRADYVRWAADVESFRADPVSWYRVYSLEFLDRLPEYMRDRTAAMFVAAGYLRAGDVPQTESKTGT
ncbi:hypothetical protein [uncultured Microbacterium sp.]|uniref:hypothetical protein n=1 Tax=uncultured Microbacterium sp. TaxID=191216 RepID=UPI0025D7F444|nr:hypothetical protein [uncultured Microbacterium sp.]